MPQSLWAQERASSLQTHGDTANSCAWIRIPAARIEYALSEQKGSSNDVRTAI